jgi:HlyD family secretion protein
MQVDTNVSESDIGNVHNGTPAEFTVDAFPNRTFEGGVTQVRQAPISIQNVVTYDVVVTVANPELLLKPGMTANVTIVTAKRDDVLRAPLQAVRFSPRGSAGARLHNTDDHVPRNSRLWLHDSAGRIVPVSVTTGLDDGNNIEIISGNVKPGDKVVIDELRPKATAAAGPGGPMAMHFPH